MSWNIRVWSGTVSTSFEASEMCWSFLTSGHSHNLTEEKPETSAFTVGQLTSNLEQRHAPWGVFSRSLSCSRHVLMFNLHTVFRTQKVPALTKAHSPTSTRKSNGFWCTRPNIPLYAAIEMMWHNKDISKQFLHHLLGLRHNSCRLLIQHPNYLAVNHKIHLLT